MEIVKQINCKIHGRQDIGIAANVCSICLMRYLEARMATITPVIAAIKSVQTSQEERLSNANK